MTSHPPGLPRTNPGTAGSDFDAELKRINEEVTGLQDGQSTTPLDTEQATRLAYRLYQRASLTGDPADRGRAEASIRGALQRVGPWPDLCLLKAQLDLDLHRLADVRRDLAMAPGLVDSPVGTALQADLDLQEGGYEQARSGYEQATTQHRTWDNLARLAHLAAMMGDIDGADRLYVEAQDEITAKQMRSFAWVAVQRGLLALTHGRYDRAWAHYRQADQAYSGYWLIHEHMAELLGARGRLEDAVALYEAVTAHVPRPELRHALGDLYMRMGAPEQAQPWYQQALAGYLESVRHGEVHYFHHLADFYADVRRDGAEATKWARRDLALRRCSSTEAALAWALYRDGRLDDALKVIKAALSYGVSDAQLLVRAAAVHRAAGHELKGERLLQRAAEVDPHYQDFRATR